MPSLLWLLLSVFAAAVYVVTWLLLFVHRDDPQALRALVFPERRPLHSAAGGLASPADGVAAAPTSPTDGGGGSALVFATPAGAAGPLRGGCVGGGGGDLCVPGAAAAAAATAAVAAAASAVAARIRQPVTRSRSVIPHPATAVSTRSARSRSRNRTRRAASAAVRHGPLAIGGGGGGSAGSGGGGAVDARIPWGAVATTVEKDAAMVEAVTEAAVASMANAQRALTPACAAPSAVVCASGDLYTYSCSAVVASATGVRGHGGRCVEVKRSRSGSQLGAAAAAAKVGAGEVGDAYRRAMRQLQGELETTEEECHRLRENIAFIAAARQELRMETQALRSTASSNSYSSCCTGGTTADCSEEMVMADEVGPADSLAVIEDLASMDLMGVRGLADARTELTLHKESTWPAVVQTGGAAALPWAQLQPERQLTYVE